MHHPHLFFTYRMLANHAGDVVTMDVIKYLWREFSFRLNEDRDLIVSPENLKEMQESAVDDDPIGSSAALVTNDNVIT